MEASGAQSDTIFVSIPSYRDPELVHTVRDLFAKARHPERVSVGVCWQWRPDEDQPHVDEFNRFLVEETSAGGDATCGGAPTAATASTPAPTPTPTPTPSTTTTNVDRQRAVRIAWVDWREARGPCHARRVAQSLYANERFHLALDSHMRFIPGWDVVLIDLLARCPSPKPLLTAYPAPYTRPHSITTDPRPPFLCAREFGADDGMLRTCGKLLNLPLPASAADRLPKQPASQGNGGPGPLPSLFWASGFSFSRAKVLQEVPYDPHLPFLFFGEESSMAARMWTHGWDFFSPPHHVIYHLWSRAYRPTFWEVEDRERLKERSLRRVQRLLGCTTMTTTPADEDDELVEELDVYGLGSARSLEEFQRHTGAKWGGLPQTMFVEGLAQFALSLAGLSLYLSPSGNEADDDNDDDNETV